MQQVCAGRCHPGHAGLDGVLRPGSFDYPFVLNERAPDYGREDVRVDRTFTVGEQQGIFPILGLDWRF